MRNVLLLLTLGTAFSAHKAVAQTITESKTGMIRVERRIDETTPIYDKATGRRVSLKEFTRLTKDDPFAYHLEPVYDEYGEASSYKMRPTTAEEKATQSISTLDASQKPQVGEAMPLFVMKGVDGTVYRSSDLKGRVVLLSFWINLKKPFWQPKTAQLLGDVLKPYQQETSLVSLGTFQSTKQQIADYLTTESLPFVPIPESYGFNKKFNVLTSPTFIVINKAGQVAAFIEGSDYSELRTALEKALKE